MTKEMLNKKIVYEALELSQPRSEKKTGGFSKNEDSLISLLIHDIFGGEILKTHLRKNWHFYNRIDGERIDFTKKRKSAKTIFEDIPSTPEEPYDYVDQVDYLTFLELFIRAFEETVGLDKFRSGLTA
jgi:hypothetical protein